MSKSLEKILKDIVVYQLQTRGRKVKTKIEIPMKEYFDGFWRYRVPQEYLDFNEYIICVNHLIDKAIDEFPELIYVGNVRIDKTYHFDREDTYVNIGIEFGGY